MRTLLPLVLLACVPRWAQRPEVPVAIETLPVRTYTLAEAQETLWRRDLRPRWRAPTPDEADTVAALVPELLQAAASRRIDPALVAQAAALDLVVERWHVSGGDQLVLREGARRGVGAYLFSLDAPVDGDSWLLWQAPHAYHDQYTGNIASALYFSPPPGAAPSAFFTNTLHRYTHEDGERVRQAVNPADPCHNRGHLFHVATLAAARAAPGVIVVQLHGFDSDEGGDRLPAGSLAVVSGGEQRPTAVSRLAATRLQALWGAGVLLFPTDTAALGATRNLQMRGLRDVSRSRFLHVETSDTLRFQLSEDPTLRDAFGAALFSLVSEAPR